MKIRKSLIYLLGIILIVIIAGYALLKDTGGNKVQGDILNGNTDNVQKIVLSVKNYNYYPNTIKVKAGIPVEIRLDNSVYGCLRGFTIPELGISKYLRTPEDSIVFTPTKKGNYRFACSMGMGTGTLIVE